MKLGPVKLATVKQYLAKLTELKKVAYSVITADSLKADGPSIESAFSFVDYIADKDDS